MTAYRIDKVGARALGRRVIIPFVRSEATATARIDNATWKSEVSALFQQHHARLVRFLTIRLGSDGEAQEVAQESYVRLLQNCEPKHTDNLQALLFVTARNIATDRLRRRHQEVAFERDQCWPDDSMPTPERIVAARQELQLLTRLMGDLSPKCRYAFVSYKFHGMDYAEIALKMGLTESMVRKYVLRAIAYCASRLDREASP